MLKQKLNRRSFFMRTGVSIGGAALLYSCHEAGGTWSFLQEREASILNAILDRIIPADDDPGAHEAGVIYFIDRQLVGPYRQHQEDYRRGLENVRATSVALYGQSFEELDEQDQDSILESMEGNDVSQEFWSGSSPASFFRMVVDHAMQGFYGSPIHGGNKDYVSYRMLGIDLPLDYDGSS
jgi:gluconate 2-dehydrogenase gamma chain